MTDLEKDGPVQAMPTQDQQHNPRNPLWALQRSTGDNMPDQDQSNQHIMDDIDNSIAQAAKGTFTPPSGIQPWDDGNKNTALNPAADNKNTVKIDLGISARKHADIIDTILAGPTNSTAIEVKNVTLATASQLLRLLASTL